MPWVKHVSERRDGAGSVAEISKNECRELSEGPRV